MGRWLRKLRGLAGLTAVGGLIGAVSGGLSGLIQLLLGVWGAGPLALALYPALWGGYGASVAACVGVLLAVVGPKKSLTELSPWQTGLCGLCGAVIGGAAPIGLAVALSFPLWLMGGAVVQFALLGGALGAGLVIAAKRAESRALASSAEPEALLSAGE